MPMDYKQLPGYPILIFEIQGSYTVEQTWEMYRITAEFKKHHKFVYRIADLSNSDSTYVEMLHILRLAVDKTVAGSYMDSDLLVIMVANRKWAQVTPTVMQAKPFQGKALPMFETQIDAIEYAKLHHSLYHSNDDHNVGSC